MAGMKKEEARRAVVSEYDRWAKKHPNDARMMGGFLFFRYLQKEKSDLLDFRPIGDKWQIVHGSIRRSRYSGPLPFCGIPTPARPAELPLRFRERSSRQALHHRLAGAP